MLTIKAATFPVSSHKKLAVSSFALNVGECCTVIGNNGSGKTLMARMLNKELVNDSGEFIHKLDSEMVSFEKQIKLYDDEWQRTNTDMLGAEEEIATRVENIIQRERQDAAYCLKLAQQFGIAHLLQQPFTALSSGEGRKVLLAQALMNQPQLLILDEPFDGLDVHARSQLMSILEQLLQTGMTLVLIVNRLDEIPTFAQRLGWILDCQFSQLYDRDTFFADPLTTQLLCCTANDAILLPPPLSAAKAECISETLVELEQIKISYEERVILDELNWKLNRGEHWHIAGPNGCGKTTLLHLITGDHPQCYSNKITLFGRRRGTGESIWEIKQHMGIVSPALHLAYRVAGTPLTVILSGFYDSIGLYQQPGDQELTLARQWLKLLGMASLEQASFLQLSYGQQRLLLIARALVKHPALLILDEPLQGLDSLNRHLVLQFIDHLIVNSTSQLLYVSHHAEDVPRCITHRLQFMPESSDGYSYQFSKL
jgi:ABC-type molybdenum transport system, ATPase component/photorepair protein PhrA